MIIVEWMSLNLKTSLHHLDQFPIRQFSIRKRVAEAVENLPRLLAFNESSNGRAVSLWPPESVNTIFFFKDKFFRKL